MGLKGRIEQLRSGGEVWVRRLGPTDSAVLDHLARENPTFGDSASRPVLQPLRPADARTFLADERTICLVAFDNRTPVGFLYACELYRRHTDLRHLCLYEVGVMEDHRDQGIGSKLMSALGDEARKRGIDRGFVVTTSADREAIALYTSNGAVRGNDDDVVLVLQF